MSFYRTVKKKKKNKFLREKSTDATRCKPQVDHTPGMWILHLLCSNEIPHIKPVYRCNEYVIRIQTEQSDWSTLTELIIVSADHADL